MKRYALFIACALLWSGCQREDTGGYGDYQSGTDTSTSYGTTNDLTTGTNTVDRSISPLPDQGAIGTQQQSTTTTETQIDVGTAGQVGTDTSQSQTTDVAQPEPGVTTKGLFKN
jgi:PBP1b-binding outer membrane lipoprotein LpoB